MTLRHELTQDRRHQAARLDPDGGNRTRWRWHRSLAVAGQDPRLSWPERELSRELDVKLYDEQLESSE
jgi:hypothetical protein